MEKELAWWETVDLPPAPKSLVRAVAKETARIRFERSMKSVLDALELLRANGLPFQDALKIAKKLKPTVRV